MNLALFDFDGTLTAKDSLGEFLKYNISKEKYIFNMIRFTPYFLLWQLKLMDNGIAKEHLFRIFFKGIDEDQFKKTARKFSLENIDPIIREDRFKILQAHKDNGDRVIIVSASIQCWLQPWCDKNNIELISTQLEFKDKRFTGKFLTLNCHGIEKAKRIKEFLDLKEYETIYAYGDSSGDDDMLGLADKAVKY